MRTKAPRPLAILLAVALAAAALKLLVLDAAFVEGESMSPTLREGRLVLILRAAYGLRLPPALAPGRGYLLRWDGPRPGELVAALSPASGRAVIKRVGAVGRGTYLPDGRFLAKDELFLLGDNPEASLDSRSYGPVAIDAVIGKVLGYGSGHRDD